MEEDAKILLHDVLKREQMDIDKIDTIIEKFEKERERRRQDDEEYKAQVVYDIKQLRDLYLEESASVFDIGDIEHIKNMKLLLEVIALLFEEHNRRG